MAWTAEQKSAIEKRGCNLLVAAAAGAGKTAVLVERIIEKITDINNPVDIDRLLVVTFTNAAASEMRERIGDAISRKIEKSPDSIRLQRQIALLNKSNITTIHSFCLEVIRNNFNLTDLDPAFRIADSTECILLKQEVMDEMFDNIYENGSFGDVFFDLVDCYGGKKDDSGLMDIIEELFEFSRSTPWPDEWLHKASEMLNVDDNFDFDTSIWAKVLTDDLKVELSGICSTLNRAVSMLDGIDELEKYQIHINKELNNIKTIMDTCSTFDSLLCGILKIEFERLPQIRNVNDKTTQDKVKKIRDSVKDEINNIKDSFIESDSNEIKSEMKKLYPKMLCLAELVIEFGRRFKERKKEKDVIDFSDIEHYCIDILTDRGENGEVKPTEAALRYREKFDEVLVDEYQDSNMVQEIILKMVSRSASDNPNLFMVGDVKQSIYRFREAKPELFLKKYDEYGNTGKNQKVLLFKNFRSREEVVNATNYIFTGIMSKNIGELDYDDKERLNPGAVYPVPDESINYGGAAELHIIETDEDNENDDEENTDTKEEVDKIQLEARMAAQRIYELVNKDRFFVTYRDDNETDDNKKIKYRPLEYRDIVILMRSTANTAPVFMEEIKNMGIPVYADTGSGYFEVAEVMTMLSLLEVIDNPLQDIPLIAVLRSPVASFTPEELIDIRMVNSRGAFYDALKISSQGNDKASQKAQEFLLNLNKWRIKSKNMPISEFIWYLYNETGYFAYAGAMPGGIVRQANLKMLFERAKEYEKTSLKGLFNFINFINKLKQSSQDLGSAKILGENENVVRIMSIHKSKGLEFPVVFVSCLGKQFNLSDLNKSILLHHELGFGPNLVDSKRRISHPTVIKQAVCKKLKLENYSEEMRILYVAMTRAKEKLILTGTTGDIEKAYDKWSSDIDCPGNKIPEHQILKGKNYLDWICPVLLKHEKLKSFREEGKVELAFDSMVDDNSIWDVKIHKRSEILKDNVDTDNDNELLRDEVNKGKYFDEVKRRLDYEYPYKISSHLPAKLTVTELKRAEAYTMEDDYSNNIFVPQLAKAPVFMQGKTNLPPAQVGTIMHLVMQHINLENEITTDEVNKLIDYLYDNEFITFDEKAAVNVEKIVKFFKSPLGIRLKGASAVYREAPFYMEVNANEVYKNLPENYKDEHVIIQGVIDCYFEEEDSIILLDYKTDYVPEGKTDMIKDRYRIQIDYYAKALEKMTDKKVKEKYIYLFYNGEIIKF